MTYKVGISTGWWHIARAPELIGLASKIGFGATAGVSFIQIDLETINEFLEPSVTYQVKRVKEEMGLEVGLHGLIGEHNAFESAERRWWENSHVNMCAALKHAAELGLTYVNFHLSTSIQVQQEEARIRPFGFQYQVVTPEGKPFYELADKSPVVKEFIMRKLAGRIANEVASEEPYQKLARDALEKFKKQREAQLEKELQDLRKTQGYEQLPEIEKRRIEASFVQKANEEIENYNANLARGNIISLVYEGWKKSEYARYLLDGGEIDAYLVVAHHMIATNDELWKNIVGSHNPEEAYSSYQPEFNAAIAARYLEGHLKVKDHIANRDYLAGMSALEWAEKKNVKILFEIPEVGSPGQPGEGKFRFFNPLHSQHFVRKINSPALKLTIDFEHMLSQGLNPDDIFPKVSPDFGKMVFLFHLGKPIPYGGTAHIPIPLGSQAQEALYKWIYMMRQKGFKEGYMIFERGGGETPLKIMEQSVLVMRLIAENLEKDIPTDELPASFYGVSEQNEAVFKRQQVAVRDHAYDPLVSLITVPEETHTFLGRAALEKGKAEEWKRGRYR